MAKETKQIRDDGVHVVGAQKAAATFWLVSSLSKPDAYVSADSEHQARDLYASWFGIPTRQIASCQSVQDAPETPRAIYLAADGKLCRATSGGAVVTQERQWIETPQTKTRGFIQPANQTETT